MKLSNMQVIKRVEPTDKHSGAIIATVDVEDGWWPYKRVTKRTIGKNWHSYHWRFLDNGEFTPDRQAECLFEASELVLIAEGIP